MSDKIKFVQHDTRALFLIRRNILGSENMSASCYILLKTFKYFENVQEYIDQIHKSGNEYFVISGTYIG